MPAVVDDGACCFFGENGFVLCMTKLIGPDNKQDKDVLPHFVDIRDAAGSHEVPYAIKRILEVSLT